MNVGHIKPILRFKNCFRKKARRYNKCGIAPLHLSTKGKKNENDTQPILKFKKRKIGTARSVRFLERYIWLELPGRWKE